MATRFNALMATVVTLLGATLGGLLLWRQPTLRTQKKRRLSPGQIGVSTGPVSVEQLGPVKPEPVESQLTPGQSLDLLPVSLPPADQLLAVQSVMVSSEEDWEQLWPSLQKELSVYPVLGLDCEWVSVNGKSSAVSLLQMTSYSGLCVVVRLQLLRGSQQDFPLSLKEVLRDPHVLKVGVGCYEDGKRLTRDYGLSLGSTVDLRYLALRQRYYWRLTINQSPSFI
nr:exonuclease 3'-5' domain-containing protein 2-like isoform X2 [Oncorhynchus nerka]